MPFIEFKTNVSISDVQEKQLKKAYGKLVEIIPGETGEFTVYTFEDNMRINFGLKEFKPCVYVRFEMFEQLYQKVDKEILQKFLRACTEVTYTILGTPAENTFVYITTLPMMAWDEDNIVTALEER